MELHLQLKSEHFNAIKSGRKKKEYRLATPFWTRRLQGRSYTRIVLTNGYPKRGDMTRTIYRPWRGVRRTKIKRPHYGEEKVAVFAIQVN